MTVSAPRNYVLVHGAGHGGWCWRRVADRLQSQGHRVIAPTLTGLGERQHLLDPTVGLDTHCQDVIGAIEAEELDDVILVGHSYGGIVVTLVADRLPSRLAQLIYLDAQVPRNGESWASLQPDIMPMREQASLEYSTRCGSKARVMQLTPPFDFSGMLGVTSSDDIAWIHRRLSDQPWSTYVQPVRLKADPGNGVPRAYVDCTGSALRVLDQVKARIRQDPGWKYYRLAAAHDLMITAAEETAEILMRFPEESERIPSAH